MEMEKSNTTKVSSFTIGRMIMERKVNGSRLIQFRANLRKWFKDRFIRALNSKSRIVYFILQTMRNQWRMLSMRTMCAGHHFGSYICKIVEETCQQVESPTGSLSLYSMLHILYYTHNYNTIYSIYKHFRKVSYP